MNGITKEKKRRIAFQRSILRCINNMEYGNNYSITLRNAFSQVKLTKPILFITSNERKILICWCLISLDIKTKYSRNKVSIVSR